MGLLHHFSVKEMLPENMASTALPDVLDFHAFTSDILENN